MAMIALVVRALVMVSVPMVSIVAEIWRGRAPLSNEFLVTRRAASVVAMASPPTDAL